MRRRLSFALRYLGRPRWDTGIAPPEVVTFAAAHPPGRALDIGCGTGASSVYLAHSGWNVTAIDFVPLAIRRARRRAREARVDVDFRVGVVPGFQNIQGPFDLALDVGCLHSLNREARAGYPASLARLLRPGASLLVFAFTAAHVPGIPPDEIEALLADSFHLTERRMDEDGHAAWYTFVRDGPRGVPR